MGSVDVHRCRFLDLERPFVTALAFNLTSGGPNSVPSPDLRLAVGKANGDIEIWNPSRWSLDVTFPGSDGRSIEDLAWAGGNSSSEPFRLFSIGASEMLTEWNLATNQPLNHFGADAGVIWAIEVSPDGKKLAVACETGVIVIFDISGGPGSVEYVKRLQSADTSLACLAWKNNNQIVAGGADARLRVWSVDAGRIIGTMKVDKIKRGRNDHESTVVWAVKVLGGRNEQIVSGDSNGFIKIWDGKALVLQQSFRAHESDVLCICTDYNNETIFSSGLDQKIVCSRITDAKTNRWTVMSSRVAHSHDIRDMAIYEARGLSLLVSGGLECTFVVNSVKYFDEKPHYKIPLTQFNPCMSMVGDDKLLEWKERTLKLWKFPANARKSKKRCLLNMKCAGEEFLTSCALTNSGEASEATLAIATSTKVRFYSITFGSDDTVKAIDPLKTLDIGAKIVQVVDPKTFVIVPTDDDDDSLSLYNPRDEQLFVLDEPVDMRRKKSNLSYTNYISHVAVNPSGTLIAVAKYNKYVEIYSTQSRSHQGSLPSVSEYTAALTFRNDTNLILATVDNRVFEFDTEQLALTAWSRSNSTRLPAQLVSQTDVCCGLFIDRSRQSRVWMWGPSWLAYVDVALQIPGSRRHKRKPSGSGDELEVDDDDAEAEANAEVDDGQSSDVKPFFMTRQYKPIFYANSILESDILVVEMPAHTGPAVRPFLSNRHIRI